VDEDTEPPWQLQGIPPVDFTRPWREGWEELREALVLIDSPEARAESDEEQRRSLLRKAESATGALRERYLRLAAELGAKSEEERRRADDPEESRRQVTEEIRLGQAREQASEIAPVNRSGIRFVNAPPPLPPSEFFDRALETQRLEGQLGDPSIRLVAMVGRDGIGKTAMVSRLFDNLRREPRRLPVDAFVYLPADGSRPIGPVILLEDLSRLVPDEAAGTRLAEVMNDSALTSPEKLDEVLEDLGGTRVVVVVDSAEALLDSGSRLQDPELDELVKALLIRPDHGVKLILVSRREPEPLLREFPGSASRLLLEAGLPAADAERYLRNLDSERILGLRSEPAQRLRDAHRLTGGNPRALEMLFSVLRSEPENSLPQLLDELERLGADQDILSHLIGRMFGRLDPVDRRVMQALAVYGRPVPPVAVDYLLQRYLEGFTSEPTLRRLLAGRLIRQDGDRFYLPRSPDGEQLLGGIPRGSATDRGMDPPPLTQLALLHQAAEYFTGTRKGRIERIDDLSAQFAEIELRMRGEDYPKALRRIYELDQEYLRSWGQSDAVAQWREQLRGRLGEPAYELHNLSWLAGVRRLQEHLQLAIDLLEEALGLARRLRDARSQVSLKIDLGTACWQNGELSRAAQAYGQALKGARKQGMLLQQAKARDGLLLCHGEIGEFPHALEQHAAALAILEDLGDGKERETLTALLALHAGWVHSQLGQNEEALECLRGGLKLARGLHQEQLEGFLLNGEAQVLIDVNPAQAIEPAVEAVAIGARIRRFHLSREANATLALAHLRNKNLNAASEAADAAARYRRGRRAPGALALQGITALRRDGLDKARLAFLEAHLQAEELHERERRSFQVLDTLGLVRSGLVLCGELDHFDPAIRAYRAARGITRALGPVRRSLRLLDELGQGRSPEELAAVRRAAAGRR